MGNIKDGGSRKEHCSVEARAGREPKEFVMNTPRIRGWLGVTSFVMVLLWTVTVSAQTFSSGSTGADGAFAPTANTTLTLPPNGVFNFTTVNIPSGVTVTFVKNAANTPVTILASGTVTVAGTISVNGTIGTAGTTTGPLFNPGAPGGPGGFVGGQGGARGGSSLPSHGHGPGGGPPDTVTSSNAGSYGAPAAFVSLLPLFGGSGEAADPSVVALLEGLEEEAEERSSSPPHRVLP